MDFFVNDLAFGLFFVSKAAELRSQFESEEQGCGAVALIIAFEK